MLILILAATAGCWLGLGMLAVFACICGARADERTVEADCERLVNEAVGEHRAV